MLYAEFHIFLKAYVMSVWTLLKYIPDNSMSNLTSFKDLEIFEPEPQVLKRQVYITQTLNHVSFIEQEEKVERVSLFSSFLKA